MEDQLMNNDIIIMKRNLKPFLFSNRLMKKSKEKKFKNGDILIFQLKNEDNLKIKRCLATEFDTIIKFTNGILLPYSYRKKIYPTQINIYNIWINDTKLFLQFAQKHNLPYYLYFFNKDKAPKKIRLNQLQAKLLENQLFIDSILLLNNEFFKTISSTSALYKNNWQIDELNLTGLNSVAKYENYELLVIEKDFYFLIGDNLPISMDSRNFGPVKNSEILGKVCFILINIDQLKFRWIRFKKMNKIN